MESDVADRWVFASVIERSVVTMNIIVVRLVVALTYDYIDRLNEVSSADSDYAVRFDLRY